MSIELKPLPVAGRFKIYALKTGNSCLAEEFLDIQSSQMPDEVAKMMRLLDNAARDGQPRNKEKCNTLGDKIFEFKTKKLRLAWFWDAGCIIVCSHGWIKKSQKTPTGEIDRAIAARAAYFDAKDKNQIQILTLENENKP
jgi:phage-related protein